MGVEHIFRTTMVLPRKRSDVFPFFADAGNLERITPPELRFQILTPRPIAMREGARIEYRLRLAGVPFSWETEITSWDPPHSFVDAQRRGPYRQWIHTHRFRDGDIPETTVMEDEVRYRLPLFPMGEVAALPVLWQVERIFQYRKRAIAEILTPDYDAAAAPSITTGRPERSDS